MYLFFGRFKIPFSFSRNPKKAKIEKTQKISILNPRAAINQRAVSLTGEMKKNPHYGEIFSKKHEKRIRYKIGNKYRKFMQISSGMENFV